MLIEKSNIILLVIVLFKTILVTIADTDAVNITFENNGDETVNVYHVDGETQDESHGGTINAGDSLLFNTLDGNKFSFKVLTEDEGEIFLSEHVVDVNDEGGYNQYLVVNGPEDDYDEEIEEEEEVSITLENDEEDTVMVYWVDEETKEESFDDKIEPGESLVLNTFHGHIFTLYKKSDNGNVEEFSLGEYVIDRNYQNVFVSDIHREVSVTIENNDVDGIVTINDEKVENIAAASEAVPVLVYWFDEEKEEETFEGRIDPGDTLELRTYRGHKYIFKTLNVSTYEEIYLGEHVFDREEEGGKFQHFFVNKEGIHDEF